MSVKKEGSRKGVKELFQEELVIPIYMARTLFKDLMQPILVSENLTFLQVVVLFTIEREKNLNVINLCKMLSIAQGNTSILCKKLASMGYIERVKNTNDERVVNLKITRTGKKTIENFRKFFRNMVQESPYLTEDELTKGIQAVYDFKNLLTKLSGISASYKTF